MTTTTLELWQDPDALRDAWRASRERRRQRNRLIGIGIVCAAAVFIVVFMAAMKVNKPTPEAGASETIPPPVSAPIAAEWEPTTTIPTPETMPTPVAPQWVTVKVAVPGWEGLGKLLTDGLPGHCWRTLPGEIGRAVISIPFDATQAGTVVVEGKEYRVETRGPVAANDLSICDVHPIWPTVMLVSSQPGDLRPAVTARKP